MARLLTALLLIVSAGAQQGTSPDLVFRMPDGSRSSVQSYRGKVLLLALLHTQCEHCQKLCKELGEIEKDYGPRGVQVLGVVFDDGAAARLSDFRLRYARGFPVGVSDEPSVLAWLKHDPAEGYFVPILAFVDRRGVTTSVHLGDDALFQNADKNIRGELESLLRNQRR